MAGEEPIELLPNLGPNSCQWLRNAGITTRQELKRYGAVLAFQRVKRQQPRASLNLLWALAAALEGKDWRKLTAHEKQRLMEQLED